MALQPLPPDEIDASVVSKPVEPGCPFCGTGAIVMQTSINPTPPFGDGPVFQSRISCLCGLRLIANGLSQPVEDTGYEIVLIKEKEMSVCAEIVVLFSEPRAECLIVSMPDFAPVDGPDLEWWVSPSGELEYMPYARNAPLLGEPSLEGRLWIGSPGRWWTPEDADYGGNPSRYAGIIRSLTKMPGVQYVWYGRIKDDLGCKDLPAVTEEWLFAFFSLATQ